MVGYAWVDVSPFHRGPGGQDGGQGRASLSHDLKTGILVVVEDVVDRYPEMSKPHFLAGQERVIVTDGLAHNRRVGERDLAKRRRCVCERHPQSRLG